MQDRVTKMEDNESLMLDLMTADTCEIMFRLLGAGFRVGCNDGRLEVFRGAEPATLPQVAPVLKSGWRFDDTGGRFLVWGEDE